ncbi:MAG: DUF1801 domain-containing protein, partial [Anaerolineae bacterium]|nr:DUF1801 domain-containing protein [Anaerolineae bacterium]
MKKSEATTVADYIAELPEDKQAGVARLHELVLKYLPDGYAENINWGMISYEIPLTEYSETYNSQPLNFVSLTAQKNHYALN